MKNKEFTFEANSYPLEPGIRLIEASAGTGKTFSLSHLVLRLLTEKKHSINEILVVSFTRATASEIKAIIGERILTALKALESWNKDTFHEHIDEVLEEWLNKNSNNDEQREQFAILLLEALEKLDHADITTIHGFCYRTLKRESIESGSHIKPVLQVGDNELIKEIAHEYWTKEVLSINHRHINCLNKLGLSIETLTENLIKVDNDAYLNFQTSIPNLDHSIPLKAQFNKLFNNYWQSFCSYWEKDGALLEQDLRDYAEHLRELGISDTKPFTPKPRKDRHDLINKWISQFTLSTSSENEPYQPFYSDIINQKNLLADYYHPHNLYLLQKRHNLKERINFRPSLLKAIATLWDGPAEIIWNHGLSWCIDHLQKKRLESGSISNRDLLKGLDPRGENVQSPSNKSDSKQQLFEKLRSRYKVALVDEFQDTDPVQWRLLKEIFNNGNLHLLIMVGDPKQAIYKFRGGDLNTYIKARKEVDRIDVLSTNFRTTPLLMNGLNKLMSVGLHRSSLKVPPLRARSSKKPLKLNDGECPLQLLDISNSSSTKNSEGLESKSKIEEQVPNIVTNHLLDLLRKHKKELIPEDICILVNNHNQAERIRKSLAIAGLPSRLVSKGDIFKSEAAQILQRFVNCLAKPGDTNALKLIACSELIQWSPIKLELSEKDGAFDQLASRFNKWSNDINKIGVIGCLTELLEGRTIAHLSERGRLLSDLNQCAQLIQEEIHRQGLDAKGAARWLKRQRNNRINQVPDEHLANSDIAESAINVITIHRSKGLQYKVVICPFLWQSPLVDKGPLWRLEGNQNWFLSQNISVADDICVLEEANEEALRELERLAYVAFTRAEVQLTILWAQALKQEGNPLVSFLFGPNEINSGIKDLTHTKMLNWLRSNEVPVSILKVNSSPIKRYWKKDKSKTLLGVGPTPTRLLDKSWGHHSYSSWIANSHREETIILYSPEIEEGKDIDQHNTDAAFNTKKTKHISVSDNFIEKNSPLADFPRGSSAGECLHKILEKFNFQAKVTSPQNSTLIIDELRKAGIDIKFVTSVQTGLDRLLKIPLGGELGMLKLNQINALNRIHEMKFHLPIASHIKSISSLDIAKAFEKYPSSRFGASYSEHVRDLGFISKGFLTGSIDLVFADNEGPLESKWWVGDWKSNWLGVDSEQIVSCGPQHYNQQAMEEQMLVHDYPLQAHLYLVALHRLLKWRLPNYSPYHHLGGYVYVFLRGIPEAEVIKENFKTKSYPGLIIEKAPVARILEIDNIIGGNR